ncbi:MAG: hypothetical protein CFE34_00495 [Rhodobacteraceae bacterium PARR1]|nr:MAG: hypothetical protein CFE34_00495 [Rhodobacteraceae bacterium PARR1]
MDRKRSLVSIVAIVAVAIAAGHFVQSQATANAAGVTAEPALPMDTQATTPVVAVQAPVPKAQPPIVPVAMTTDATVPETAVVDRTPPAPLAEDCPIHLDLVPQDGAMLGVTLVAPCHAEERVILSHAGLTVTARTTATGSLFTALPALDMAGEVTVTFADKTRETAMMPMPELQDMQRFVVQWSGDDRFALNAFRDGATYGEVGHLTAQPLAMLDGITEAGTAVVALGDPSVPLPLLAEVYTLPTDGKADLTVEAQVTAQTCGRELLGEMLDSRNGKVTAQELSMSMPDCDALGGFIVLNNPRGDLTLASSE